MKWRRIVLVAAVVLVLMIGLVWTARHAMYEVDGTLLVDDISNVANACYAAWPERIYVVDTDGTIVYKGGIGPFRFDPEEVEQFLRQRYLG